MLYENINPAMLTDFYEFTMSNGYFTKGFRDTVGYFDLFFRRVPDNGGFAIMAGLEQAIECIKNFRFSKEDIAYFRNKGIFAPEFIDYLENFRFECDVWAIREGTPIFPNEPLLRVRGPVIQAQLIETIMLICINHQSLIATKANRIVRAAKGRPVIDMGARRAQGADGAVLGARSAYIGGCVSTACVSAEYNFGVPAGGTMAHSWVQLFDSEYDAFKTYCELYPDNCTLLVDTYNVLKQGVPNAIKAFNEVLVPMGKRPNAIRIDSGDIAYLTQKARKMLDEAGFSDCKIVASNSLDEIIIRDLIDQGAQIDIFGVGERLITSKSEPVFGGVYKLVALEKDGKIVPKIKISENVDKITNPGFKQVYRLFSNQTGKAIADVITLDDEVIDDTKPYEIFDPINTWKRTTVEDFSAKKLLEPIFEKGRCVYNSPSTDEIRAYCKEQVDTLWNEVKRFENPHKYYVDLSQKLWDLKQDLLRSKDRLANDTIK